MMRTLVTFIFLALSSYHLAIQAQLTFTTSSFRLGLDEYGALNELIDIHNHVNYAATESAFLVGIKTEGEIHDPVGFKAQGEQLSYLFPGGLQVDLKVKNKGDYLRLEVVSVSDKERTEALVWGPIRTTIGETVGEFVGVVRNMDYAMGIQALNVKTTGGALVNDEGKVPPRGSAALVQEYGSSLQAFCIDRSRPQAIEVWNGFGNTTVVPNPDFGVLGSAIALFGIEEKAALKLIGQIEREEGLPHILIEGEWVKSSPLAGRPYIISNFGESTVDMMLDFTEKVGFYSLYQSHPFSTWGHFNLIPSLFPNGREGMKACVEKARERDIRMGVHTLTNFITTNDSFVSPVPHPGLAIFASTVITENLGESDTEISIKDSTFYHKKTTLQTIRIGDELIRYSGVSEEPPFRLLNCKRGAFGTLPSSHIRGEKIARR